MARQKAQIKLKIDGVSAVLRDAQSVVDRVGSDAAAELGDGYEYVAKPHAYTARGFIQTASREGQITEAREKRLHRILGR